MTKVLKKVFMPFAPGKKQPDPVAPTPVPAALDTPDATPQISLAAPLDPSPPVELGASQAGDKPAGTTVSDAVQQAADEERKRATTGKAATLLTGPSGDEDTAPTAKKKLLGY